MKIDDALKGVKLLFLDTSPVVYFIEENPAYQPLVDNIFKRVDNGLLAAVASAVTLAECLVVPYRLGQSQVHRAFVNLLVHGQNMTFVPVDSVVAARGAELRASYNLALTDAFQVAAALVAGADAFLTNDLAFKRVQEIPILVLDDLEL